jgi:Mor family transcriptional regulator
MKDAHDHQSVDLFGVGVDLDAIDPETYRMLSDETAPGWTELLRSMFDNFEQIINKHRDSPMLSLLLLSEHCRIFGGAHFYVPNGKTMTTMLRSIQIWKEFTGDNTFELSRKFGVSVREVQFVLARMRRSEMRKIQGDMFAGLDPVADGKGRRNRRVY